MGCERISLGPGVTAIVCGRPRRRVDPCSCGAPGARQCDFPLSGRGRTKVCNRFLCPTCSTSWSLVAPVQPAPEYRKRHVDLDLCRAHAGFVAAGRGPALVELLAALRGGPGPLHGQLAAAALADLPDFLDAGARKAVEYVDRHRLDAGGRRGVARIERLGAAMGHVAASLRAAGDPVAVHQAEKLALAHVRAGAEGERKP